MALFLIERPSPHPAEETWRRLTQWQRHGRYVPLSSVALRSEGPTRVGSVVVARTGVGRAGFEDPMEVVRWEPPGEGRPGLCRLEKRGSVVLGWAEIEVWADGERSRAVWREEARVARLPRALDAPTAWAGRLVFGRVLRGLLEDD
ncbi:SRPBCC family protein [Streptomyces botrytidirepellens]|uniref:SRPBCC family protein n=1 Tax=Streptomyces botrytidirepellens TaxID=2486417 RepID=A0A3M8SJ05_9ACTN|nr:SRPBCC family protein [Streptomyces botrytidirepellens]RNF81328.1 SRPBCC family protein [Streptomyces botrytidirepellens]